MAMLNNQREGFNESNPVGQITGRNIWMSPLIQPSPSHDLWRAWPLRS